jgi:hypothetical protein
MRRRPQIHGRSSTRSAAGPLVGASPGASSSSFVLFCGRDLYLRGKHECSAGPGCVHSPTEVHELLHRAIDEVTAKFEEAQSEYQLVNVNSRDGHKWKGEMIAYANVVALLEDLKSRSVFAE